MYIYIYIYIHNSKTMPHIFILIEDLVSACKYYPIHQFSSKLKKKSVFRQKKRKAITLAFL